MHSLNNTEKQIYSLFKTNDKAISKHIGPKKELQKIYQIIAGYFNNNDSDELTNESILINIFEKEALASQQKHLFYINMNNSG